MSPVTQMRDTRRAVGARPSIDRISEWLAVLACVALVVVVPASVGLRRDLAGAAAAPARWGEQALRVTVRDASGAAVPGAVVRVLWGPDERYSVVGEGRANAQGQFDASGLPAGASWVIVDAPGFGRASMPTVLGREETLDAALERAVPLDVRVTAEDGSALAGATVLVTGAEPLPFGAVTGADGHVRFGRLGTSPWKVRAFARGYESESRSGVTADATLVLRRAGVLEVHTTDESGKAVPGATVLVVGPSLWPARSTITDADGLARLTGLLEGAYDLKATRDTLVSTTEVGVRVERGETRSVSLVLSPGRMVPFIVTDGEGDHPVVVANADVLVAEGGVTSFPIQGRTNTFGKVTLGPIARGFVMASASAEGFVTRAAVDVPEVVREEVRIPLLRGATLEGDVVDAEGHPIGGATVEIVGTDVDGAPVSLTPTTAAFQRAHFDWALQGPSPLLPGGELGVMPGPIPPIPPEGAPPPLAPLTVTFDVASEPWVTRTDGSFRATPVPPGRIAALVRHPSYVEATSEAVTLAPGGTARVRVVLLPGGTLEGTVVDEHGLSVVGARVDLAAAHGSLTRGAFSADDGTFTFSALPAEVYVTLSRPGDMLNPVLRRRIRIPDRGRVEEQFVLPAPLPPIEIEAEDESSRPVAGAQVTVLSLDPERPLRSTDFTDEAGRVTFPDAAGLSLKIVVEAPDFAVWSKSFDPAKERIRADLVPSVIVEGRVTAVRGRQDLRGATVEILSDGHRQTSFTDAAGHYRFQGVTPGRAHLSVSHPDHAPVELDVVVKSTGRADRSFDVDPINLDEPAVIEGRVVNADGAPASGARVGTGSVASYLPAMGSSLATTRSDGTFRLERVRAGSVRVEAFLAGTGRGHAVVEVDAGDTVTDVQIELQKAADDADSTATGDVAVTLDERGASGRRAIGIVQVARGSEAEHAGLLAGDVIQSIDQAPPTSAQDARQRLAGPEGSDVVIEVLRGGEPLGLRVRRERVRR